MLLHIRERYIFFLFCFFLLFCFQTEVYADLQGIVPAKETIEKELDDTIAAHFKAIKDRDIAALLKTVNRERVTLILPNGKYSHSFADYKAVNIAWFKDPDWKISYRIIEQRLTGNMAVVLSKIDYRDRDRQGKPYGFQYYLTLLFEKKQARWKLVFDQNTIIKK